MSFEEYWETDGSRRDTADHKERARLAWETCDKFWLGLAEDIAYRIVGWQDSHPTMLFSTEGIQQIIWRERKVEK